MNSPVRHLNPEQLDAGVYSELMRSPQLVRGPDGRTIEGPPTIKEVWDHQEAERKMLARAVIVDKKHLDHVVHGILREQAATGQPVSAEQQATMARAMQRVAVTKFAEQMARWRQVRTYWSFIMWQQSVAAGMSTTMLEHELDRMVERHQIPVVRVLKRPQHRKRGVRRD